MTQASFSQLFFDELKPNLTACLAAALAPLQAQLAAIQHTLATVVAMAVGSTKRKQWQE